MKVAILILCVSFLSAALLARDLSSVARKERARRQKVHATQSFTNADLDVYTAYTAYPDSAKKPPRKREPLSQRTERDLAKEEAHWRKVKARHDRELARLDASVRRLEWRLNERRAQARRRGRLIESDPSLSLMEESLESLREERTRLENDFRERARKAGAFPGWLR